MNTKNFKTNPTTIFELSSRTIHKIIARASLSCSICKWDKATGDIHHIVEVSEGGSNDMSNLIYVCPNCHRCIHQLGDIFISKKNYLNFQWIKHFQIDWITIIHKRLKYLKLITLHLHVKNVVFQFLIINNIVVRNVVVT